MKDFAAIHFETADKELRPIRSVGSVIIQVEEIPDAFFPLTKTELQQLMV